jgi:Leucyl aminopeptidase (aminopeptidase T)
LDPRITTLARTLIHYSTALAGGEKLLIETVDGALPLAKSLVDEAYRAGAVPFLTLKNSQLLRAVLQGASDRQLALAGEWEAARMKALDAYIAVRASDNISEMADVPAGQLQLYQQHWVKPVHLDIRVPKTKWCVLRYPGPAMAQLAGMSTEAFENFYFRVCTLDYAKMAAAMDPLIALLERTDRVRITGPGTDLAFSVQGIAAVKCAGPPQYS